ncbi:MAG: A/G-specific adenine glycosylase [Firmicutes bacterium]|nr:A/G-specific adenine glycosylase [Bacillota bacterium]
MTNDEIKVLQKVQEPLIAWYDGAKRDLPWRNDVTPYRVWLSEIMLQQTRVEAGRDYFLRFTKELPDVEALANVSDELLMKLWEGLGYYNRARNLKKAAGIIMEQYGGELPSIYEELLELPGIGPYTAGAIASIAFGRQRPAVDGNVLRVVMRLLGRYDDIAKDSVKKDVEAALLEVMTVGTSHERPGDFNQSLMELGATVCIPNGQPHCDECPWTDNCKARKQGIQMELPVKLTKKKRRIEKKTVLILRDEMGRLILHRRDDKGLLAGLWELPEKSGELSDYVEICDLVEAGEAVHIFSHVEWHMTALTGTVRLTESGAEAVKPYETVSRGGGAVLGEDRVTELQRPYLRDVKEEPVRWILADREQIKNEIALPSAFKGFKKLILE